MQTSGGSNPYRAPGAELVDKADVLPPRPRAVSIALGLVLGAVLLQVRANVYILQENGFHIDRPMVWSANAGAFVLLIFLCHQMAKRRSWPRMVLLVVTLVTFAQFCLMIGSAGRFLIRDEMLPLLPRFIIVQVLPLSMNLAALHLLFFSSGAWFHRTNGD